METRFLILFLILACIIIVLALFIVFYKGDKSNGLQNIEGLIEEVHPAPEPEWLMEHVARFDIETFNKRTGTKSSCRFTESDGTLVVQSFSTFEPPYEEKRLKPDALFAECRRFYSDGAIKEEVLFFRNGGYMSGFRKGIVRYYNERGDLVKEENLDRPYDYSWEDVQKFAKREKIDLFDEETQIIRGKDDYFGYVWVIMWNPNDGEPALKAVRLSGKTGEKIKEWRPPLYVDHNN